MEILNNIWMALSTPNQPLINIFMSLATFLENYLMMTLFISLLNIMANPKQKIKYILLTSFASILSMFFIPNPFNIFFNYISMIAVAYYTFDISFLKSIACIVTSGLTFNLLGGLILNPFITILNISTEQLSTVFIYRIFYVAIMYSLLYLIIFILRHRKFEINFIDDIDRKTKFILFFSLLLGIITIIVQSITLFYYVDTLPISITFLNFVSFFAYFSISIYSLTRVFKLTLVTRKLQSTEEYNHSLRVLHDNVRGFKHDFDNIVTTIGGFIRTNDMEGLKKYYVQLEDDCQRVNNLYILNPEIVNNDGIYNLLTKKYNEAEEKDIKVNITFLLDLSTLKMKIYEFARILGILLDNAIEATSECEEKIINLTFRSDNKNSRQLIIVENTYSNKDIDTEKIFEKGFSEKQDHTGLGLWEVRKIIKKNNNINLHTTKTEKFFTQQLEIYY